MAISITDNFGFCNSSNFQNVHIADLLKIYSCVALNVQVTNWLYQYKIHCYSGFKLT